MENKQILRKDVPVADTWDLSKIYADKAAYDKDFEEFKNNFEKINDFKGKLNNAKDIKAFFEFTEKMERILWKLETYAGLTFNQDLTNTESQIEDQKLMEYITKYMTAESFAVPEMMANSDENVEKILNDESLKEHRFSLERMFTQKPHVLSGDKEEAYASVSEILGSSQQAYSIFTNAELKFPDIADSKGEMHKLTQGTYISYLMSEDRVLRENAFKTLHNTYGKYEKTLAHLLTTNAKAWNLDARIRGYKSAIEKALKPNNIPVSVFENAVATIDKGVGLMHRYMDLKAKALKVDELHMYDLYVAMVEGEEPKYSFDEGVEMALVGLKPMGEEYLSIFREGVKNRWMDKYENVGKRSGAYSAGCYDSYPYISLNYHGTLDDISTMVHEMGHSIHSYYTRGNQPYQYGHYSIFLAEVASTCNEKLLIHDLIKKSSSKEEKLGLINQELEQIRTTVYRQLMFAQFEKIVHEKLAAGEALTAKEYDEIYYNLNKKFYGDKMVIDEEIKYEWSRIPHFYNDFYVYQYATGYAAASSFAKQILEKGQPAADRYINNFLKAGASKYPVDVLKDAGVDMTTPQALEDTLKNFEELMDLFEKEMNA